MNAERNYNRIQDKLLSEENLNDQDLHMVLGIGLDFISGEINENPQISNQLGRESSDFQRYFRYAALVRLVHQYQDAKNKNLTESESYKMFGRMKNYYISQLNVSADDKNSLLLEDKIVETICCNPDLFEEDKYIDSIGSNMSRLANMAAEIVPNNPKSTVFQGVDHPLD